uniref:Uncharacterized protein n=1 Tax=Arundo donax TaxID=35708 RepID=A0A0A9HQN7_ARUDO
MPLPCSVLAHELILSLYHVTLIVKYPIVASLPCLGSKLNILKFCKFQTCMPFLFMFYGPLK